jgi:hypothetical protein
MLQRSRTHRSIYKYVAVLCTAALLPGQVFAATLAASPAQDQLQAAAPEGAAVSVPPDQLDSLVAPIALYPDPVLAQVLAASTYPLELLQLQQWLQKNPGLKDKALLEAVEKQSWDPSIQAMAALPDLVKRLVDDIQWTTDLGNVFLAQQGDVLEAVQRMRRKAHDKGTLTSTPQQTVQTQVVEDKQVIVIEQADPEVIYVPSYDPLWAYGEPFYPYPSIYYPTGGLALSFGVGVAMGAFWGGGGWGWGPGWGNNNLQINHYNNINRNANIRAGNTNLSGRGNWQHQPAHRGGAPYRDRATADKFGGTARGDSLSQRQTGARQQVQRQGGNVRSGEAVGTTGIGDRAGAGSLGDRPGSAGDRSGATSFGGSSDRIGSHDLGSRSGESKGSFGSSSGGFDGSKARSGSSRGGSSMRGSGGMSRGGGGRSRGGGRRLTRRR